MLIVYLLIAFYLKNKYTQIWVIPIFTKHNQHIDIKSFDVTQLLSPEFFGLINTLYFF